MPNTVPAAAEGLPEINRRKALSVTGAGLVAALSTLAVSTCSTPAAAKPDSELLDLGAELDRELANHSALGEEARRLHGIWRALVESESTPVDRAREDALMDQCSYGRASEEWNACHSRLDALVIRINAIPAATVAGFAVKATALLWDMFIWEDCGDEPDHNETVFRNFVAAIRTA